MGIEETRAVMNMKYKLENRRTKTELFEISEEKMTKIRTLCKSNDITVTQFFSALMLYVTDAIIINEKATGDNNLSRKLRFLLSVGLRPFGTDGISKDWTGGTIACAGGALDFVITIKGKNILVADGQIEIVHGALPEAFVNTAKLCRDKAKNLFDRGFVQESVRLFGLGMKYADILQVCVYYSLPEYIYIYIYVCVCVCVYVCAH